ncbi:MAG: VWA domain-containing protein [Spirochaetota bacterium]|nr:VWA domain-containing protein [Spirochaetota bacterium]
MKKIRESKGAKILMVLLVLVLLHMNLGVLHAGEEKDLILVLDTSLSMIGYGGKNILAMVKKSLSQFIHQLDDGDSITFITFDTRVRVYPTVFIDNSNDKDIINKYISIVEANGKWTYTMEMIKTVLQKAQELEEKEKDRQRLIVILTDALDDPPPEMRKNRLNINDVTGAYQGKDWFIYFVNLGDLKKNKRMIQTQEVLKKRVSKYTKIIDAEENLQKSIEEDLKTDVERMTIEKRMDDEKDEDGGFSFLYLLLLLLLIAIVALLIYYFRQIYGWISEFLSDLFSTIFTGRFMGLIGALSGSLSGVKLTGKLEYWDHTIIQPYINTFNITKQQIKELTIGRDSSCTLRISDIEIRKPFTIVAQKDSGTVKLNVQESEGSHVDYINKDPGGFLENGDMFKVANYTFRYLLD